MCICICKNRLLKVKQGQTKCVSVEQICHKQILQQIPYEHQNFQVLLIYGYIQGPLNYKT